MFEEMIEDLKKAKYYIFMEFFIVEEGYMWGSVLEILKEKNISITEERIKYRINEVPDEYKGFGGGKRLIEDEKNGRAKRF